MRLSMSPVALAAAVALVLLITIQSGSAMTCTRRGLMGQIETFQCPGFLEKPSKMYCCGTEMNRYCCKRSKAAEHGYRDSSFSVDGGKVVKGLFTIILVVLLVVGSCIALCCFCVCYALKKKRTSSGGVLSGGGTTTVGGQAVHMVNNPGNSGLYPAQTPSYPQYPTGGGGVPAPAYPTYSSAGGVQPPPYPAGSGSAPYPTQPPYNPNFPQ